MIQNGRTGLIFCALLKCPMLKATPNAKTALTKTADRTLAKTDGVIGEVGILTGSMIGVEQQFILYGCNAATSA